MISQRLYERFYAGDQHNGTKFFYQCIRASIRPGMTLLNLGAGPSTGSDLRSFRGLVDKVIGADIDPVIFSNDELDEAVLITDGRIPLADSTADIIVSDYVLEHVEKPDEFMKEVFRVLRPRGIFFFRTPNLYHYVSLIARFTPHWFHELVANRVRGLPTDEHEPYPTFYRMNTRRSLIRAAKKAGFGSIEFVMFEGQPSYLMFASAPFLLGVAYERMVNRFESLAWLKSNIFGRIAKD